MNAEVLEFYNNLGKWFLHFSEPESLDKAILPKNNRNLGDRKAAVIYRRGVRVREFESSDVESLFDYNLNDLSIDESRKASDWDVKHGAGKALADADKKTLAILFDRLLNSDRPAWEFWFDHYSMQPSYGDGVEAVERRRKNWQEAFAQVAGDDAVLTGKGTVDQLERKGFTPVLAPESLVSAAAAVRRADFCNCAFDRRTFGPRNHRRLARRSSCGRFRVGTARRDRSDEREREAAREMLHVHHGRWRDAERLLPQR